MPQRPPDHTTPHHTTPPNPNPHSTSVHPLTTPPSPTETAPTRVAAVLQRLSGEIYEEVVTIIQAAHWGVVLAAAMGHTVAAKQRGWSHATLVDFPSTTPSTPTTATTTSTSTSTTVPSSTSPAPPSSPYQSPIPSNPCTLRLLGMTPYWIDRAMAVKNDVDLDGVFLLTAPNMSGKSTLMRSILVAALLGDEIATVIYINSPIQHTLSIHPFSTPYQFTHSAHPINSPIQHTLPIHPFSTPYQFTLSTHTTNTLSNPSIQLSSLSLSVSHHQSLTLNHPLLTPCSQLRSLRALRSSPGP